MSGFSYDGECMQKKKNKKNENEYKQWDVE